jgi:hypothetical protein
MLEHEQSRELPGESSSVEYKDLPRLHWDGSRWLSPVPLTPEVFKAAVERMERLCGNLEVRREARRRRNKKRAERRGRRQGGH